VDQNGNALSGYFATFFLNGDQVGAGFTPSTYQSISGVTYSVQVGNFGDCSFNHWQDTSSTTDLRWFTAQATGLTLTAVYSCARSAPAAISVSTVNSSGSTITGYYTTLWQNGVELQSCFSDCTFAVISGQNYQVQVAGYGSESLSHRSDGSATAIFNVTTPLSGGMTSLTAVYTPIDDIRSSIL